MGLNEIAAEPSLDLEHVANQTYRDRPPSISMEAPVM